MGWWKLTGKKSEFKMGWWKLTGKKSELRIWKDGKVTSEDLRHIADKIEEGYTEGELV
jgi:hypothetical protein